MNWSKVKLKHFHLEFDLHLLIISRSAPLWCSELSAPMMLFQKSVVDVVKKGDESESFIIQIEQPQLCDTLQSQQSLSLFYHSLNPLLKSMISFHPSPALSVECTEMLGPLLSVNWVLADENRVGDSNFRDRGSNQQQRNTVNTIRTASTEQPTRTPQASAGRPQIVKAGPASIGGGNSCATMVTDCWWMMPSALWMVMSSGPANK